MNLRILSKSLIPVGPGQAERDRHANPGDSSYVSARTLQLFKESNSTPEFRARIGAGW